MLVSVFMVCEHADLMFFSRLSAISAGESEEVGGFLVISEVRR